MQTRKSKEEWMALIEEQRKSGLSKINFCREKGIATSRFYYYRNQLLPVKRKDPAERSYPPLSHSMIPIKIKNETSKREEKVYQIKLRLNNGLECILPSTIDKSSLKEIIEVLVSC